MLKVIVFAILVLGSLAASGMIGSHFPTLHQTAVILSGVVVTWGMLLLLGMIGFSGWVAAKI